MRLNSIDARNILEEVRKEVSDDRWIDHCICVGDSAGTIAKALNEKGYEVDIDKVIAMGYIHDIGRKFNSMQSGVFPHAINGYKYIKSLGYDEEYAGICIKHSFLNNDIDCLANDRDETDKDDPNYEFVKNYIKEDYLIEEKIINLCDLMCTNKIQTVDKRMIDLLIRHGVYKNTQYHIKETYKLKQYFDDMIEYNLYNLFPEIKENL